MAGRLGASLTFNITKHLSDAGDSVDPALRRELCWAMALLDFEPWRSVNLTFEPECTTVISDASWMPRGNTFLSKLAYWVFPSGGAPCWSCDPLPAVLVRLLQPRDSQIMVAELIACIISVFEFPELCEHKAITFHLDNSSGLMALIKGSSGPLILPISPCPPMLAFLCSKLWQSVQHCRRRFT